MNNRTVADVVGEIVEKRDALALKRRQFKDYESQVKLEIDHLEVWLREQADLVGVDGFKTSNGTAYRKTKESYRVGNWDDVLAFIQETDNWQMLEKRIAKNATKEIWDEMIESDEAIPGVDFLQEVVFEVRRPTK